MSDAFEKWWVARKGRPPTPDEAEEFERARAMWDELWASTNMPAKPDPAPDDREQFREGWRACAMFVLQNASALPEVVFRDWGRDLLGERFHPTVRALRNEAEDAFIVAMMRDDADVASLGAVERKLCEVSTTPGEDEIMRQDYRAAEAFAALLSALPSWAAVLAQMRRAADVTFQISDLEAPALPEPKIASEDDDGEHE